VHPPDENGIITYNMVTGLDGKMRPSRRVDRRHDRQVPALRSAGKSIRARAAEVKCNQIGRSELVTFPNTAQPEARL